VDDPALPGVRHEFRQEVFVPDHKARVAAVEVLLREGLGRPGQAEEPTQPRPPESEAAVESMSWKDMQYLAATLLVDELAVLHRAGGERLVQNRVATLTESERRALRAALAEHGA
jgi:hypothetical protein